MSGLEGLLRSFTFWSQTFEVWFLFILTFRVSVAARRLRAAREELSRAIQGQGPPDGSSPANPPT